MGKRGSIKPDGAQATEGREWAATIQAAKAMGTLWEAGFSMS